MDALDTRDMLAGWAPNAKLVTFARALDEAGEFTTPSGRRWPLLLFFERPYNWNHEYAAWNAAGKPVNAGDEGWSTFLQRLADA